MTNLRMLVAMRQAMPHAYANGNASVAMHGRTDGRTNEELTHVTNKTFCSDTCTRVQKFRFVRVDETRPLTRRELGAMA